MILRREWAMPSPRTFSIPPIRDLIARVTAGASVIVDPFARNSLVGTVRNDLDEETDAQYHMDATDFLRGLPDASADAVLYDPPYSPRQIEECYRRLGRSVSWRDTSAEYWGGRSAKLRASSGPAASS